MIFIVAFDPASIRICASQGAIGGDHLVGVLQALLQNCLIAEIRGTWRISQELVSAVKEIPEQGTRKTATALLEKLLDPNRYRFVEVITGFEDDDETELGVILASQIGNADLDVVVCESESVAGPIEVVSIHGFNRSNFARDRSRRASAIIYAPGSKNANEILDEALGRLIKHSNTVTIFDRVMGETFNDNYFHGLGHWCDYFIQSGLKKMVRFHTTRGQEKRIMDMLADKLDGSDIDYDVVVHEKSDQPHDRFLRAGAFTLDIGRGIDLFDENGVCRDVKIGLSDHGAFTRNWGHLEKPLILACNTTGCG